MQRETGWAVRRYPRSVSALPAAALTVSIKAQQPVDKLALSRRVHVGPGPAGHVGQGQAAGSGTESSLGRRGRRELAESHGLWPGLTTFGLGRTAFCICSTNAA